MGLLFCSSPGALETLPRSAYPPATPFGTHSTSVVPSSADRMSPTGRRRVQKADIGSPQNFQHFSSGDCYRAHSQDLTVVIRDIEQAISTGTPVQIAPSHLIPNRPCSEPAALQDLFGQKLQDIDAKAPKDFQISKMERRTSRKPPPDVTTSLIRAVGQSADARFLPQSNANPSGESFSAGSATFDSSPVLLSNTQNMTPSFCKPCESLQKDMDGCLYECTDVSSHNAHGLDGPRPIGQERSGPGENTIKYNAAMNEIEEALKLGMDGPGLDGLPVRL